ncbi:MAG: hypothetical protein A2539_04510 [Elusimicrobia bacterium RIFOXYD2_FULL_34_15]|nr:MAG: hypothetical protein A2539_04510 [Elusimicrobia bacterium RIFOXYD2_FULL_34_15]
MKKYKAVLFDFDGVIGKTMDDNYNAWRYALSKYNIDITKNEYFQLEGMSTTKTAEYFLSENSKSIRKAKEVVEDKEDYFLKNNKFSVYTDVKSLLPYLKKKGYSLGLVSGGSFKRIAKSLSNKLLKYFDVVLTSDRVKKCKPHPEPYLTAAKMLSVKPYYCLAVENAPLGIESAKRAKMDCIAITSTLDKKYLKKADKIIKKLGELRRIL